MATTAMVFGKMTDTAQAELAAIRAGDIDKAYSYTSTDFQSDVTKAEFKKFIAKYPELATNVSASFPDRDFNNDQGDLKGSLTLRDGKAIPVEIHLVKEAGVWKILGIELPDGKSD
jgi:hypothetical protein